MKNFICAIIAISLCLPVLAQKTPPSKSKVPVKTEIDKKPSKDAEKKVVKKDVDSTYININMDKPLDQYLDSLKLTEKQIQQIDEIENLMNQRQGMSRAHAKMTKEEIASEEKETMIIRNNKIRDILTREQIKEIYLLQNGKLIVGLSSDEVIRKMELKPSQQEEINKMRDGLKKEFEEANNTEDEVERIKLLEKLDNKKVKIYKEVLNDKEKDLFDAIKSGKIEVVNEKEKKQMEAKAAETNKKG